MPSIKDIVALEGDQLRVGSSIYIDCPSCGRKDKMGITRTNDGILFHCFSSHCGRSGISGGASYDHGNNEVQQKARRYVGHTNGLTDEDRAFFLERFGISPRKMPMEMLRAGERYFFPIRDFDGQQIGEVLRQPSWSGEPIAPLAGVPRAAKAVTYIERDKPKLAWYRDWDQPNDKLVVIVEDPVSAMKIRQTTGYTGVALLGSSGGDQEFGSIADHSKNRTVLWLDPDMNSQAFQLAAKYGGIFNDLAVVLDVADPKDLTPAQIEGKLLD